MPSNGTIAAIVIVVISLGVDYLLVRTLIKMGWAHLPRGYAAQPIAEDAVRRNFQSFRFGLFNFGHSVHVAADGTHLHLLPSAMIRWVGARPVSIPWEAIELKSVRGTWATVKVGSQTIKGPAWALKLAAR